jgi:two-component system, NarL family, sensor histidine kinase DegS
MVTNLNTDRDPIDLFIEELQGELDQSKRSLRETTMMIEQSQGELNKLAQRNATVTGNLQQMQGQFENLPRTEIRNAYNAVVDTQQRLLVMRGQLQNLQTEQKSQQRYISQLEHILKVVETDLGGGKGGRANSLAMLEMVVKAQEAERLRLSRQMHDGPAQALSNFIVQTEIATRYFEMDPVKAKVELQALKQSALTTFQKVRTFIFELRPMMLDDLGLFPTMRRYIDSFKEQTGVDVALNLKGQERRLESYLEVMIFRALQELMGNAVRHNQDTANKVALTVAVVAEDRMVKVSVSDTGKGFDPDEIGQGTGLGLKLIRERVELLGGYMDVDSAPGAGARISFQIPLVLE